MPEVGGMLAQLGVMAVGCTVWVLACDTVRSRRRRRACICAQPLPAGQQPRPCPQHGWMGEHGR